MNTWLSLIANIGVVAGIVFVGIEINQNNRLLQLETSADTLENRRYIRRAVFEDTDIAEIWFKANNGAELSEVERFRVQSTIESVLLGMEWEYLQSLEGNLPPFTADITREVLTSDLYQEFSWEQFRSRLTSEFLEYLDNKVLN